MTHPNDRQDAMRARYEVIAHWFEQLTSASLDTIETVYSASAVFSDPFNDLAGIAQVKAVYTHMFETLSQPRFTISRVLVQGAAAFMLWTFEFQLHRRSHTITGCTYFEVDNQGLITVHRDYWDAATQVYEKIPVLGMLLRWLRKKLAVK